MGKPGTRVVRKRLTYRKRGAFLDHLAATCNVTAACRVIDVNPTSVYFARRTDPDFAAEWRAAILTGYDRIEALLLQRAGAGDGEPDPATAIANFDPEFAFRLLGQHLARLRSDGRPPRNNRVRRATPEETNSELLRRLELIDRQRQAAGTPDG